jgi:broad specificity phosphatase PhoE
MSLRLWLVRHGESTWNAIGRVQGWADPPLSELGEWQAHQVARRLADVKMAAVYTSTLQRAFRTAQIISNRLGIIPVPDPRLREHGMGEATGMIWQREDVFSRWPFLTEIAKQGKHIRTYIPGAEPLIPFIQRIRKAVSEIRQIHREGDVTIVAHGGVFRAYLADLLQTSAGGAELSFGNVSLSQVEYAEENCVRVRFVNDCCHLIDAINDRIDDEK